MIQHSRQDNRRNITGVLLAAGTSSRFHGDKLTQPIAKQTPMVLASLQPLLDTLTNVIVVISPHNKPLEKILVNTSAKVSICDNAHLGMGASLAHGIRSTPESDAWLIALADMPFIKPSTFSALIQRLDAGALICAPDYKGQRGHPVGFSKTLYPELTALNEDVGARQIIKHYANQVSLVKTNDSAVIYDIDYRHQLNALMLGAPLSV